VEFALLLPLLLLLVFGIIDFGRGINTQITLTQAAREGARLAALGQPNVVSGTQAAATGLKLSAADIVVQYCPANATQTTDAKVTINYPFSFLTPVGAIAGLMGGKGFKSPIPLTATGEMPCES
jgi:Flp pilus assembly protein TadG